jgi:hypothetical protein
MCARVFDSLSFVSPEFHSFISNIHTSIAMRRLFNFRDLDRKMTTDQTSMLTDEEATLYDRQIRLWGADAQLK